MKHTLLLITLLAVTTLQASSPGTSRTLAVDTQIPLVMNGKTVGSMTLKAGASVNIVKILSDNQVLISRGDSTNTFKVSKDSLTPESINEASLAIAIATPAPTVASEAKKEATKAPEIAPTAAVSTASTPIVNSNPAPPPHPGRLTEKEYDAYTASLIQNGQKYTTPDHGFVLTSYYYNPLANASKEDLTISLKDLRNDLQSLCTAEKGLSYDKTQEFLKTNTETWKVSWVGISQDNVVEARVKLTPNNPSNKGIDSIALNTYNFKQEALEKITSTVTDIRKDKNGITIQRLLGITGNNGLSTIVLEIQITDKGPHTVVKSTSPNYCYKPQIVADALSNQQLP